MLVKGNGGGVLSYFIAQNLISKAVIVDYTMLLQYYSSI